MDNLCHTLAGAALAEAGLKQRTRFGTSALVIASNLPDVDVLVFFSDTPSVAFRRGWTHGPLAQVLLPVLLTAAFVLFDRWRPPRTRGAPAIDAGALLLLTCLGVVLHVGMDWLNSYGVRLLMPFSGRWFYGDAIFIIDPWLWLTLAAGIVLARRARRGRPARAALILSAAYILAMIVSARAARATVLDAWVESHGRTPAALMVGPAPVNPLQKVVIVDDGEYYERGRFTWVGARAEYTSQRVPKNDVHPAAIQARHDRAFEAILSWSRFPVYEVIPVEGGTRVTISDMRFSAQLFRASTIVPRRDLNPAP
jgi:inner membrane protein